ncbi:LysR substrate-binding domain-containing protein [Runella aurantiaca]|uniref:LysR family transcriptional regulator n=1 Tax=Runella aurantiaca TaxID=2282308 RepID=A0A369IA97_9BACT|nr:LysR substrate-binding domain-containing protein [Runella aurantiaca]RDB06671.1 LysR family transcriptional regulator [Runella aurantiaca]
MLSIRHQIFIQVALHLSFSKASEILFISQPAVSKHIKNLEYEYKMALFERKGTQISLTPAGEVLLKNLLQAKEIQENLVFEMSALQNEADANGQLRLGASTTVALYVLPKILSAFHRAYPNIEISLMNRNSTNILKALIGRDIDLGIIEGNKSYSEVEYSPFLVDEIIPICSSLSDWKNQSPLPIQKLKEVPIVLREYGSGTLATLTQSLLKHDIRITDLKVKVRLGGTEALKNFLLQDTGLGFLPERSVKKELETGELYRVEIAGLKMERDFSFIQRQGEDNHKLRTIFRRFAQQNV